VAHQIFSGYPKPASVAMLGSTSHPLSGGVADVNGEDPIGLKWGVFFFPFLLFSLLFLEIHI